MKRALILALALSACGEPAEEPHPRCANETDTAWSCSSAYSSTRERCADGQLVEESCSADEWCLSWSDAGAAPYEGRCMDRQIDYRCPADGDGPCPDGLVCYKSICRVSCGVGLDVSCPIAGTECYSSSRLGNETPSPVCVRDEDKI